MIRFYWPWLILLLPLPFLVRRNPKLEESTPKIHFPTIDRLKNAFPSFETLGGNSNRGFFIPLFIVWSLLVLSVMQPEKVEQFTQIENEGYDLMLAVDISASMQALDLSTRIQKKNRLDVTKEVVGNFVRGRQGDRVGLITFGENAYLHVPLTLDTLSVGQMLQDTRTGMAGNATAIGDAIGLAVRTLRERPEGSRVLVLLTDGEDNSSSVPPIEAAKLAKQYGIKIYTVGVGRNGPVPFPGQFGGYGMVEMSIDEDLLKEISSMTGGRYYRATDQQALQEIYNHINTLEKTKANVNQYLIREPLYYYPLGTALFLLLILTLIPIYKRVANEF